MVLEHQNVCNLRWSVWLHGCLYTHKSLHVRDPLEWWTQLGVGVPWMTCPHAVSDVHRTLGISAFGQPFPATRNVLATGRRFDHALDDLHLNSHSGWQHNVSWGPQRAGDLQSHPWALSAGTEAPDES